MPRAGGTQPQKYSTSKAASHLPVNIHLTGCPNSCALHCMGDIGCLGTKSNGQDAFMYLWGVV
jgi:ferredoxin-nitrite reductase